MKSKFFVIAGRLCFILVLLIGLNCNKDDTDTNSPPPPPPPGDSTCSACQFLNYDLVPNSAPTLDAGFYEAAARFTPVKIGTLVGKEIREIHYYIVGKADSIKIKLYGPLSDSKPGNLLYSADVKNSAEPNKWNIHVLTETITLKNEDIWLSVEIELSVSGKVIACDAAPEPVPVDGDWLYSYADLEWIPFNKRTFDRIRNWNIRLNIAK